MGSLPGGDVPAEATGRGAPGPVAGPGVCGSVAPMATYDDCAGAVSGLGARLAEVDPDLRRKHAADRTVSCRVPDLDVVFSGRLVDGELRDITTDAAPRADLRFTVGSDDLLLLTAGELSLGQAWATGRLKVEASMLDLLRMRAWL